LIVAVDVLSVDSGPVKSLPGKAFRRPFAMAPAWLWAVFTVLAATSQTFRNAAQSSLTASLGTVGATQVRFLFGLPFAVLSLAGIATIAGPLPELSLAAAAWTALGAVTQILATALMLAAMRERSFVVTIAYTKTEPVQVAIFGVVFLGEHLSPVLSVAIVIATVGVILLSWPSRAIGEAFSLRPALLGLCSGALFAIGSVGYRGAILALETPAFVAAATLILALALTIQTVLLTGWLLAREPQVLQKIVRAWRRSLAAGFLGAFASQMWFLAFALQNAAAVRTLGLVEILVAGLVSRRLFAQTPSLRDIVGMALVVGGIILLLNG
jgi:drug/metabolite transporter (DMT)-like permease